ncbi:DNA phosphorothioation-associated protein 4 [Streptomyces rubiginosohelvolus]
MAYADRFRRPRAHEDLLGKLTDRKTGTFSTMVEAMMFAALLGRRRGERKPFDESDEPIRLALMESRDYGEVLLDMLGAIEYPDDPKILSADRQPERVLIFEEYANAGLSHLKTLISRQSDQDLDTIISNLVLEGLRQPLEVEKDDVGEILASADLDW